MSRTTAVTVAVVGRRPVPATLTVPAGGLVGWQPLDDPVPS